MGADNWTVCPRCVLRHEKAAAAKRIEAQEAYGKLPIVEWQALNAAAEKLSGRYDEAHFREDYEIGVDAVGVFSVRYSGQCRSCGLTHKESIDRTIEGLSA